MSAIIAYIEVLFLVKKMTLIEYAKRILIPFRIMIFYIQNEPILWILDYSFAILSIIPFQLYACKYLISRFFESNAARVCRLSSGVFRVRLGTIGSHLFRAVELEDHAISFFLRKNTYYTYLAGNTVLLVEACVLTCYFAISSGIQVSRLFTRQSSYTRHGL